MKKKMIAMLAAFCLVVSGACAYGSAAINTENAASTSAGSIEGGNAQATAIQYGAIQSSKQQNLTDDQSGAYISKDAAKSAALKHAGLTESDVTNVKVKLDHDDGKTVYEIEFYAGNAEYDYEVDAFTGDILSYDYDVDNNSASIPSGSNVPSTDAYISKDAAKSAALKHAGLTESDVSYVKVKLDHDDGQTVYDIEFYAGNAEYDYEVDAFTGDILSYDYDVDNNSASTPSGSNVPSTDAYISKDAAKSAALKHAGLTESDVTYVKVKLDHDDGIAIYEIEFISGGMEYEMEINAMDGTVLEYDVESMHD